jgi:two-component system response regulator NreC
MDKIRILIAEDHNLVRNGLAAILEEQPEFLLVGKCEDGKVLTEQYSITKPDIVVSDISMPNMNGIQAAMNILSINKKAKIIFLTVFQSDEWTYKAIKIGAYGLVQKQSIKEELVKTILLVNSGQKYFAGKTENEIREIKRKYKSNNIVVEQTSNELLSGIEKEILFYIGQGLSSEEIAEEMRQSKKAIDELRNDVMEKLNLKSLPQLIKYAVEFTFIENEKLGY